MKKVLLLLSISLFTTNFTNTKVDSPAPAGIENTEGVGNSITKFISESHLNTYASIESQRVAEKKVENKFWITKKIDEAIFDKNPIFSIKNVTLNLKESATIASNLLLPTMPKHKEVIGSDFIKSMELVLGGANPQASLVDILFGTYVKTVFGKFYIAHRLTNPTKDISELKNVQLSIQAFVKNEHKLTRASNAINKIQTAERDLLLLFNSVPAVNEELFKGLYFKTLGLKKFNNSSIALELTNRVLLTTLNGLNLLVIPLIMMPTFKESLNAKTYSELPKKYKNFLVNIFNNNHLTGTQKAGIIGNSVLSLGLQSFNTYGSYKDLSKDTAAYNHLQQILIKVAEYIEAYGELRQIIISTPELKHLTPKPLSTKLASVISNLKTNTFKGEASYFSYSGRILSTYYQLQEVKDELIPTMHAVGELDMYVALAKLYKDHQDKQNSFCFAEFITNERPEIHAVDFWNPFLNAQEAVANDAHLDKNTPNIILTGPNTCGKSTILKGLVLNVLFAQTFGIAPAKSISLTPFTKIHCYLNIADDISTGTSLFKAEVLRAKKLLESLRELKSNELSLIMADEIFTGTAADEGAQAAEKFVAKLAEFINSINIIATHYAGLTELEATGKFKNFWTKATRNADGSITRFFKMVPGICNINIAFDILQQEGIF